MELIACAFKSHLQQIRQGIKKSQLLIDKDSFYSDNDKNHVIQVYIDGLKKDLDTEGNKIIQCIDDYCISVVSAPKPMIFFTKLKADIYRYMCQHHVSNMQLRYREFAHNMYERASFMQKVNKDQIMQAGEVCKISSLSLGLALNYAIFLFDLYNEKKHGLRKLTKAITDALEDFDKWEDDEHEIEHIKQQIELIQECITKWKDDGINTESDEEN